MVLSGGSAWGACCPAYSSGLFWLFFSGFIGFCLFWLAGSSFGFGSVSLALFSGLWGFVFCWFLGGGFSSVFWQPYPLQRLAGKGFGSFSC